MGYAMVMLGRRAVVVLALSTQFLVACSDDEADTPEVGAGFPQLALEGYVNEAADGVASAQPITTYSSMQMQQSGRSYALVHLSESF